MNNLFIATLFLMTIMSAFADEASIECVGDKIEVKVMTNYDVRPVEEYILITQKSRLFQQEKTFQTPLQVSTSLDPNWTSTAIAIPSNAAENKGELFVGKGGAYIYMFAPKDLKKPLDEREYPAIFNFSKVKKGKTIPLKCQRKIFG